MSQRWRAVGNTVSDLTARDLNLRPPARETNALPLDQLAGQERFSPTDLCSTVSLLLLTSSRYVIARLNTLKFGFVMQLRIRRIDVTAQHQKSIRLPARSGTRGQFGVPKWYKVVKR